MSIFPITPLVRQVQKMMLATFEISEQAAEDHAAELVAVAEGWGTPEAAEQKDWEYFINKRLSEAKYKWRSDADRERFEAEQKLIHESYESEIGKKKRRRS